MKSNIRLMTKGAVGREILTFAFPVFLANLFQQLYLTVDSLVIGNFVGKEALAAITSVGPLVFLLVGLFNGLFIGAGVVISKYFGSDDADGVSKSIHTTVALGFSSSALVTIVGIIGSPYILRWMGTPAEVFSQANSYVEIYFIGISSLILYNMATGILQALGDSRHPLYFLIASSLTNIVLDLLFVGVLDWGMDGAAYATIISEAISAVLSMGLLFLTKEQYRVHLRQVRFHGRQLGRILHIGIPSGIQNSVISIANVFVQASVNSFGAAAMAGNGAFLRIQGFVFLPITSFALALTTFTSQNIGAGELGRVRKGIRFSLAFCLIMAETFGLFLFLFAKPLLLLFSRDPEVLAIGTEKAHIACFFFCCLALSHTMAGIFRGAGRAIIPMLVMLVCWCLIRVSYIFITLKYFNDIRVVFWAYPITWTLSSLIFIFYYFKVDWLRQR